MTGNVIIHTLVAVSRFSVVDGMIILKSVLTHQDAVLWTVFTRTLIGRVDSLFV